MPCIFFVKKGYQPWGKPRRKFYSQVIHCRSSKLQNNNKKIRHVLLYYILQSLTV